MPVDFGTRPHLTLMKVESTPGVDSSPVPASNAVRTVATPTWQAALDPNDTNEAREAIDAGAPIPGGGMATATGGYFLTGAGTAGQAPDWGVVMRGAAMQQVLNAADINGTSQAVAAGSVTLAAGASSTDNLYRGMVIKGTSGFYNGQERVITAYNGTTKVATVYPNWTGSPSGTPTYTILACAAYSPVSQGAENITWKGYKHGIASGSLSKLRQILGAMGNVGFNITAKRIVPYNWTFSGQLPAAPTDVSKPSAATFVGAAPEAFRNASVYLGGVAVKLNSLSCDLGNAVSMFPDPAQAYGNDTASIQARRTTVGLQLPMSLVATQDIIADFIAAQSRPLWLTWGSAYGKKVSIYYSGLQYTGPREIDISSFAGQDIPCQATGENTAVFLTAY